MNEETLKLVTLIFN